ncbi:Y-family DNA polymerase [Comamonas sediminis]|uniref:Y-family DNA polymerase n=1 Tax=Comamonas sediminis TaxID=1783360 RepID=A0ABV4B7P0_9BURK
MFALVDGNNFYVSCERAFRPSLIGRPVVVLSNNDGCAIARSNEAKDLGIKMGAPYFQIKHLEITAGLVALSANFALYGDMSERMMSLAAGLGPEQEIYSIDESFISLAGVRDVTRRAWAVRERIARGVGIPCGIGIGPTKTLAKLANAIAKDAERKPGSYPAHLARVCNLAEMPPRELQTLFEQMHVGDVWGIGRRISNQLNVAGIANVWQLTQADLGTIRRRWSVVLERTVRELRGESCIAMEEAPPPKKMIACTRSFGHPVEDLAPLIEAVSEYASRAAEKLRRQGGLAGQVQVFAHTSPFRPGPRYSRSVIVPLVRPSADTSLIARSAIEGIKRIYEPGFELIKAGVILLDICDGSVQQNELALGDAFRDRSALYGALDKINTRYGRGTLHLAATGMNAGGARWGMRQERRTPHYTTNIEDIPVARC